MHWTGSGKIRTAKRAGKSGQVPKILAKLDGSKSQPLGTFFRLVCVDVGRFSRAGRKNVTNW
jgi:hypothetical protein